MKFKKLFFIPLLMLLNSCDVNLINPSNNISESASENSLSNETISNEDTNKKYSVTLTGSIDLIKNNINNEYGAGDIVYVYLPIIMDAQAYLFVNNKQVNSYEEKDGFIVHSFVMPEKDITIHITMDQFYGKNEFTFEELFNIPNDISIDTIDRIYIKNQLNGALEGSLNTTISITDKTEIEKFIDLFEQPLIKTDNLIEPGQSSTTYYYIGQDNLLFELSFHGNNIYWYDFSSSQLFEFKDPNYIMPAVENISSTSYSFVCYQNSYEMYLIDDDGSDDNDIFYSNYNLRYIEFSLYDEDTSNLTPNKYLMTNFGKIYFVNEYIFIYNNTFYEIINMLIIE